MAFRTNKTPVLQTKSASGSVASFNTALAMPLVNGEFTIQAYQEGTGDPAPDNVRNIVPFNTQKITKTGKNLFDYDSITIDDITFPTASGGSQTRSGFIYHLPSGTYTISARGTALTFVYMNIMSSDDSFKEQLRLSTSSPVWITKSFTLTKGDYIIIFAAGSGATLDISSNEFMIEVGSTATDYEPYKAEVKTVALGEDVYGGYYNSVTGKKKKKKIKIKVGDTNTWIRTVTSTSGYFRFQTNYYSDIIKKVASSAVVGNIISDSYKTLNLDRLYGRSQGIAITTGGGIAIYDTDYAQDTSANFMQARADVEIVFELAEPIESNIGATEIETFNGSNNIFCDTGDTSVTFKDLDIAKRGNFREVFKLPS